MVTSKSKLLNKQWMDMSPDAVAYRAEIFDATQGQELFRVWENVKRLEACKERILEATKHSKYVKQYKHDDLHALVKAKDNIQVARNKYTVQLYSIFINSSLSDEAKTLLGFEYSAA